MADAPDCISIAQESYEDVQLGFKTADPLPASGLLASFTDIEKLICLAEMPATCYSPVERCEKQADASGILTGGDDGNRLVGTDGDDTITGGSGDDVIISGGGNDLIIVGAGNDIVILEPGSGPSVVILGEGMNTIQISGVWDRADYARIQGFSASDSIEYETSTGFVTISGGELADLQVDLSGGISVGGDGTDLEVCSGEALESCVFADY